MKNVNKSSSISFHDYSPEQGDFLTDVIEGLSGQPKTISPKYFYDQYGSELFDEITKQPEYYITRTEINILQENAEDIARFIGPDCVLIELGSGVSEKIRLLFNVLSPASYLGIDISKDFLLLSTRRLSRDYPEIEVHAVCADFTHQIELPVQCGSDRLVAFFPGSSIGNFEPDDAVRFLKEVASMVGKDGKLLIGVDLKKDSEILNAAYNDAPGVTADFNLNILKRMRTELDADVDMSSFSHRAFYNEGIGRVEMHLVSQCEQAIVVDGEEIALDENETIHTENSYKYNLDEFADLSARAGFRVEQVWMDNQKLFSVQCLVAE
jgi:dimethylhistidine N-methyltransferase